MRAIQLNHFVNSPTSLIRTTLPHPTPPPNHYLIRIHATSLNFFDLLQIRGKYQNQPPFPFIAGYEFAGIVTSPPTPSSHPKYAAGTPVFGSSQGAFSTHITVPEEMIMSLPHFPSLHQSPSLQFTAAASLYVAAHTSHAALCHRATVKSGDWVLVHSAAGGVGLAAVQIAKALGAKVIATAGSDRKLEVARRFGADHGVNYDDDGSSEGGSGRKGGAPSKRPTWPDKVKRLTPNGRGVDVVIDPVGLIAESLRCSAWGARLVVVGFTGGDIEKVATNRVLLKNVSVMGLHYGSYRTEAPEALEEIWRGSSRYPGVYDLISSGRLRDISYTEEEFTGLQSIPAALKKLEDRSTWGKIVVKVPHDELRSRI